MITAQVIPQESTLAWRGIHHIALSTHDIDATVAFYRDILGVQVSEVYRSRAGRGRHAIILVNPTDPNTLGLHFFERTTFAPPSQPASLATAATGNLLHFALYLDNAVAVQQLRDRLQAHAIEITEIPELHSFVFSDNNALLIEVVSPSG